MVERKNQKQLTCVLLFLLGMMLFPLNLAARGHLLAIGEVGSVQQSRRSVSGVVVDGDNNPLPGVTVQVVGREGGVITDADGAYAIQAATGDELRFQFLGLKTEVVEVGTGSIYNVQLVEDVEMLEEVTVTAFATQKRESVVSSIETINPKIRCNYNRCC